MKPMRWIVLLLSLPTVFAANQYDLVINSQMQFFTWMLIFVIILSIIALMIHFPFAKVVIHFIAVAVATILLIPLLQGFDTYQEQKITTIDENGTQTNYTVMVQVKTEYLINPTTTRYIYLLLGAIILWNVGSIMALVL